MEISITRFPGLLSCSMLVIGYSPIHNRSVMPVLILSSICFYYTTKNRTIQRCAVRISCSISMTGWLTVIGIFSAMICRRYHSKKDAFGSTCRAAFRTVHFLPDITAWLRRCGRAAHVKHNRLLALNMTSCLCYH